MTIRPTPRRFGQDDLDDVFSAIIPPTDAATADKLKTNVKPKKMDPLQRRLSMSAQKRNEVRDTENVTAQPIRTPKVSFSPYNRHHPYNPALRVSSSLKQAVSYTTSAPNLGDGTTSHILAHATPLRPIKPIPQPNSAEKDSMTISTIGSSSVVGSTPQAPVSSRSSNILSPGELLPTPSGPTTSTPLNRNPLQAHNTAPGSISLVKSILKRNRGTPIRLAATVEEGTRENTEQARWGSSSPTKEGRTSTRPALKAADSFQLLVTRSTLPHVIPGSNLSPRNVSNATTEGVDDTGIVPSSDDTIVSEGTEVPSSSDENAIPGNGNNEKLPSDSNGDGQDRRSNVQVETSSIPDDGVTEASTVDSLLDIIMHEADDLMAVEDAYNLIQVRYRKLFAQNQSVTSTAEEPGAEPAADLALALDRFQQCSSDIYRSFIRDISRLVGTSISSVPPPVLDSSPPPNEHLNPTQGEITPSPSPEPNARLVNFNQHSQRSAARVPASPILGIARLSSSSNPPSSPNPTRQGYSEAEVRYRRALAGVGQSSLRFLAFVFHRSELYRCFSDTDITSLISSVLVIPNTPKLRTPNPKKSYALAMYSLCHLKVPVICVQPIKEKLMRVLTYGLGEGGLKCWGGGPGKREGEGGNVKARFECFAAMANALVQYPSLFIPRHKDLIPLILGGLIDGQQGMKVKAGMALCGFMKGRLNWLRETERAVKEVQPKLEVIDNHEPAEKERILAKAKTVIQDWKWARKIIAEAEVTTVTILKSNLRPSLVINPQRAKFSDAIGDLIQKALSTDPLWACAMWACLVSMMGQAFLKESARYRDMNSLVLSVLGDKEQQQKCAGRTTLCGLAWNHTIYAIFNYRSQQYIKEVSATPCKYYDINYPLGDKMMTAILSLPSEVRRIEGMLPETAKIVRSAEGKLEWNHVQPVPMRTWLERCANSITPIIYAYTGTIMRCIPRADQVESVQCPVAQATLKHDRLGKIFDEIVMVFLPSMLNTKALDGIIVEAWSILSALVQYTPNTKLKSWSMSRLLCEAFFRNESVNRDLTPSYRDRLCLEAAGEMVSSGVQPDDIPALDTGLICSKFVSGFGTLFLSAVTSLRGIEKIENTGEWIKMGDSNVDAPLLPKILVDIWQALMHHLSSQAGDGRLDHQSLAEVTRILVELYKMDVALYTPIDLENEASFDPEVRRIQVYHLLVQISATVLDSKFSQSRLTLNTPAQWSNPVDASNVITADASGNPTPAGYLLQHVLHSGSENNVLSDKAANSFIAVFRDLATWTCTGAGGKQTLGQLSSILTTSHLSEANGDIAWGVWTVLCRQWSTLLEHVSPSTRSVSNPDNTLVILANLLSLPFRLCARNPARTPESWSDTWAQLSAVATMRCKARQQSYLLSLVEPICKSILALEDWQSLVFRTDATWLCMTILASEIQPTQRVVAELPMSYLSMVDQLVTKHSPEHSQVSRLLSAALNCCDIASLELGAVERLWCTALSTPLSVLNKAAEKGLTGLILTALESSSSQPVRNTLARFSPVFCHLLQRGSTQDIKSFREIWNASFGQVKLDDKDMPTYLLVVLRDLWDTDTSLCEMPAWKEAREASQAARRVISTADYEADKSNEAEPSNKYGTTRTLSEVSETQSQSAPSSSPNALSASLPDSQEDGTEIENKTERRKAKRSGKKQRSLKRSSHAALESEEGSQSQSATRPNSQRLKDATVMRESKRQKISRSSGKGVPSPFKSADEPVASSSSPSRRSERSTSGRFVRKAVRSGISELPDPQEAPAQMEQAVEDGKTVIARPEQPEDRVEVVLPAFSQTQRDSADSADREQILVRQPAYARKRSLMPEFTRVLRANEDFDRPPSRPSFSRSRVLSKTVSNPEHMRQQSQTQSSSKLSSPKRDVFALIQQAAQLKHTIRDLDDDKINDLLGTLEVLRSTGQRVLTDRYEELRNRNVLGKK